MTTTKKEATKTSPKKPRTVKVASLDLPKQPLVFEVLDLASKQRSKAKKVEVLQKYEELHLKIVFKWNFDETIKSALPPGEVPYSSYDEQTTSSGTLSKKIDLETRRMYETGSFSMGNADQQGRTTIRREAKNFYHFVKGGNDAMNGIRRESMFIIRRIWHFTRWECTFNSLIKVPLKNNFQMKFLIFLKNFNLFCF